ncbi:Uncharacterized protein SCF082_LOCUS18513, partial [Durusdinium trenchii]
VMTREPGMRQRIPVRCTLCTSLRQKAGKIFDMVTTKPAQATFFLRQHAESQLHMRLIAERQAATVKANLPAGLEKACQGMALHDETIGPMHHYGHHMRLWLAWRSVCPEIQKHTYTYVERADGYELRHSDCLQVCSPIVGRRDMCQKCASLDLRRAVVKCVLKKFAAQVLFAKLFETNAQLQSIIVNMKDDIVYQRHGRQVDKLLGLQVHELQQWVRSSFLSIRSDKRNTVLQAFMSSVIEPCLQTNVTAALDHKPQLLQVQSHFERFLTNPDAEEMDRVNVAVAQASLTGRLQNHPLIQGLILTCLRVIERQESGVSGTKGRIASNSAMSTETARSLAQNAGQMLAIAGGNSRMLALFGAGVRPWRNTNYSAELEKSSLPVPMQILCWDPMAETQMVLPAAELPLHCADIDAKAVLRIVDAFMIQAHHFVRALVFDGATQHQALRRICYGNLTEQDKQLLQDPALRFFSRLAHTPLPEHDLPRLPIRVPSFEGEPFFCLGGPCHATKNTGGQVTSPCRTVHMGRYWVDMSGALLLGLPGTAYTRKDPQSDALHALLCSPWFYTATPDAELPLMRVCWSTRGALLWSLCSAMCFSPTMHKSMTLVERLESCVSGFVAWDLFQLVSAKMESDRGARVGSMGMAPVTLFNLQNVSLSTIVMLVHREVARFGQACARAYQSAIDLVLWASGYDSKSLKAYYEQSCDVAWFETTLQAAPEFDDDDEEDDDQANIAVVDVESNEHKIDLARLDHSEQSEVLEAMGKPADDAREGKRPKTDLMDAFYVELTEASLAAARDARQQQANGWRTGAVSSTGRIRRRRFFKSVAKAVKSIKQKKSSAKTSAKTSKVKKVPGRLKASKPQIEPIASNFRRSVRGAELIKQQMQTLLSLDKVAHPKYPAFDAELPMASGKTWAMILEASPGYFNNRYQSRSRDLWGDRVSQHIELIRKQLQRSPPVRSAWLRTLREICELV